MPESSKGVDLSSTFYIIEHRMNKCCKCRYFGISNMRQNKCDAGEKKNSLTQKQRVVIMNVDQLTTDQGEKRMTHTPIVGRTWNGSQVWYTGKSGKDFVSADHRDAFLGYSLEGAQAKAEQLNRMSEIHGVLFVAVTGDLLDLFTDGRNLCETAPGGVWKE